MHHGLILGFDVLVDPRSVRKVLVTRPSEEVQDNAIASAVALDHCQKIFDRELEHSARSGGNHVCLAKSETPRLPLVLIVAQYLFARGNESYLTKEVTALEFSRDESSDARMCRARVYEVHGCAD